jgi:hypothetical protein
MAKVGATLGGTPAAAEIFGLKSGEAHGQYHGQESP